MPNIHALIVEDEKPAQEHLARMLRHVAPDITIAATLERVSDTRQWLAHHRADLLFLDIHLADALSFKLFEQTPIDIPIIFTTAYDEYALRAFKVNSIDYLLKPIDEDDLRLALEKFRRVAPALQQQAIAELLRTMHQPTVTYQDRFLVQRGERLLSVSTDQIAYFEGEDRYVYLVKKDGSRFIVNYRLSDLEALLSPKRFFRLNRSFIAAVDAIASITTLSKTRLKVELAPLPKRDIVVSYENNHALRDWLNGVG